MDSDKTFDVEFGRPTNTQVSGGPDALRDAVNDARNGDTLIVAAGVYNGNINFRGKLLRLFSVNPNDPNIVAQTIIDCANTSRAFTFNGGEDANVVVQTVVQYTWLPTPLRQLQASG
jgi:hypothetical protein